MAKIPVHIKMLIDEYRDRVVAVHSVADDDIQSAAEDVANKREQLERAIGTYISKRANRVK